MSISPADYSDLVRRAKNGDTEAFGEVYKIFLDRIYRFVYSLVLDEPLAEDITQNSFVKAWKYLPKFSLTKGTFQAFLYKIARNLVIDHQRKRKELVLTWEAERFIPSSEDIEEKYVKKENRKLVRSTLAKLVDFDRQLVILRYFEELSYSEIGKIVSKKPSAVRVRVHRALKIMRDKIT